ncbi:TadE/TadG family type IV pilus assembly protein [Ureibacillus aquaedulcis]|uniref:TadE/TadG family type IV pilus assembly protein n=1 Tax=Ureibacillus aquaedulcis TaxID=3058421 RepID=A0ABT8GLJ9_9BACL|nr:TadE/TadG family type IV pilus assembly protein [Ureibacillus sp. BA0131]MDN4492244.1 TadE/TadG family type IV pilus assembly protein [Ureibacillus sp. BA0131]
MKGRKLLKEERGSLSIEFLGILPLYFLLFLLLWQVVASGYAVISLKSAASDGAQVYAVSGDWLETEEVINKSIGSSSILSNHQVFIQNVPGNADLFEIEIKAEHPLVFLPDSIANLASITIDSKATGKVLVP